jgi:RNA polymerase sigma-70 factor (ECF subfamily)
MAIRADDLAIVAAFTAGNESAEAELDARYRNRLRSFAARTGIPAQDAEDIAQEAMAAAMAQLRRGAFRGDSSLATWLHGILRIRMSDYWRRAGRTPGSRSDLIVQNTPARAQDLDALPASGSNLDVVLEVRRILQSLPVLHRTVLILNQFHKYTTAEIAARLGRPAGTIGRVLAEAKERFRKAASIGAPEENHPNRRLIEKGIV